MSNSRRRPLLALALAGAALLVPGWQDDVASGSGVHQGGPVPIGERELKPEPEPEPEPKPPSLGERAARIALEAVGAPYRWGGESPATGFDCSGLVRWSYGRLGIDLPHSSYALAGEGRGVPTRALEPGDVLLFAGLGHVGLYLGDGRMVHAPQSGRLVEVVRLGRAGYGGRLVGARRVVAA